ncbi:sigma-70 family RNA polymerase sigma factor [Actinomadura fulvescens]|uniref:Sigma-70 family RNA polymerase sigma factor n=1 Tax=Actinomadura fulvescens TaxID=46160 RepID=A0ABP6C2G7_9ACTN
MAGGSGPGQFDDPRLAGALRAGDVIALTEVYDTYAPFLFDYCHGLLRDRVEAAGALRNCLIAAREHVAGLHEPERLRGWLYAIARKESMRRRDEPNRHTGQEAPEAEDGDLSEEQLARRAERRALAHSALGALSGRQREAIDLSVRHELDAADMAGIFGLSLGETELLLAEAETDLEAALRAALIAQNHWEDCPSVSALTETWPLPPPIAQSLVRHVATCPTCGPRETPRLPADRLMAVLPIAAIPGDLRLDVLTAATSPDRADTRRGVAALLEPFDERGWPVPYQPGAVREREPARRKAPLLAIGAALAVIAMVAGALTVFSGGDSGANSAGPAPSTGQEPSSSPPDQTPPGETPLPTASSTSTTPSPSPTSTSPTPSTSPSVPPSTPPGRGAPPSEPRDRDTPPPPPPPRPGSLAVSGCHMGLDRSCAIRITALGGPVNWQVTGASGDLSAGGSGHLQTGQSIGVTVSRTNGLCWGRRSGTVSFAPGGAAQVSYC